MIATLKRIFVDIAGPSAVMAAGTMGAGAVTALLLSGAWFGYSLIWVVILMAPFFVIAVNTATRIGAMNHDVGLMSLMKIHIHPSVVWVILLINIPLHFLVCMGQISVMYSAFVGIIGEGFFGYSSKAWVELIVCFLIALGVLALILSKGYNRMQTIMTSLMVVMFLCFLVIALKGFSEIGEIALGVIPSVPQDLPYGNSGNSRSSITSIIGIVGSAIAPAALLGMPYYAADAGLKESELKNDLRRTILNLGVIFSLYAIFIIIAGGYALNSMANFSEIDSIAEAGRVLETALPVYFQVFGPKIFALGLFLASLTTLIVTAQISSYVFLDGLNQQWHFSKDNKAYLVVLSVFILGAAVLGPLWDFPALLKVLLLMATNLLIVPTILIFVIYLSNKSAVMSNQRASLGRSVMLVLLFIVAVFIASQRLPSLFAVLKASLN